MRVSEEHVNAVITLALTATAANLAFHLLAKLLLLHGLLIHRLAMDYKYINYYEYTRDGLNNTDKLYVVVFVYLFYHSNVYIFCLLIHIPGALIKSSLLL